MAIPSGSGTEVLRRGVVATQSSTATTFRFDGTNPTTGQSTYAVPANHIITILCFTICEAAGNAETISMWINDGAKDIEILQSLALGARETFVWNDKFSLIGGDKLKLTSTAGDVDIYYSYLDQDWS